MSIVRTRMAPSPTGEYHIGSMRTFLYNYAWAKKNNGQFVLRIEDTDKVREVDGAVERIKKIIKDYRLDWDEYYVQSERNEIYVEHAHKLVELGKAYYCFCTEDRLNQLREEQKAKGLPKTSYDGFCRGISSEDAKKRIESGDEYVVRLKVPKDEKITFTDFVIGEIEFDSNDMEDQVLLKSDGFPTYHLAVVVDDHLMNITHVMRGHEWLPSTPKHVLIYKAFGWDFPKHGHIPLLKEKGANKKLSKRFGDVHAVAFLESGYLPEAMLNFLMFLGWNPGGEREIYTLDEFISEFDIAKIHTSDLIVFDREKLLWFNGVYIRSLTPKQLWERILNWAREFDKELGVGNIDEEYNLKVTALIQERMKILSEFIGLTHYFYAKPSVALELLRKYSERTNEILKGFVDLFREIDEKDWNSQNVDKLAHEFIAKKGCKPKEAFMTLRAAVTGEEATPPIFDILGLLGKDKTLKRLL